MPSYLVTGVARGLGYEWVLQLSANPENIVIGLVRNKTATETKINSDPELEGRSNIHILEADLTDYNAIKQAAADTSEITCGKLDYLIQNAGVVPIFDAFDGPGTLSGQPQEITKTLRDVYEVHVISTVHVFNLFLPLIREGSAKKVIATTTGYADDALTRDYGLYVAPFYSASKAAQNTIVAKYHAQYADEGILFLALAPGSVDVGQFDSLTEEQQQKLAITGQKFMKYEPDFAGPITTEESIKLMLDVIKTATVEENGGDFLSQKGNKRWL
ncbi:hypothetical protein NLU13_3173 [Sarocladium strictum]|uniref:NAD(P)-binding protein n=1 Tax=Sarocladium strictum TaxID=5046 RepID=A0AA39LA21_SARSR|nr:hypothetical protein NLU13_3173 [Sarocladium strictum]